MSITSDDLTWMFRDAEWRNKFLIGSLLALAVTFVPLVGLAALAIIYGYALMVMRAELRGETRVLPKWQNVGALFADGLQAALAALGYLLPAFLIFVIGFTFVFFTIFGGALGASATRNSSGAATAFGFFVMGQLLFFFSLGIGLLAYMLGLALTPVAVGQYARTGDIGAGYRWSEVRRVLRANFAGYMLAWAVYWGIALGVGFIFGVFYYTIILCVLVPFLTAPLTFYLALLFAQLFGAAYREGARKAGLISASPALTSPA